MDGTRRWRAVAKRRTHAPLPLLAAARAAALPPLNVSQRRWQPCENAHELAAATNGFYNSHCWASLAQAPKQHTPGARGGADTAMQSRVGAACKPRTGNLCLFAHLPSSVRLQSTRLAGCSPCVRTPTFRNLPRRGPTSGCTSKLQVLHEATSGGVLECAAPVADRGGGGAAAACRRAEHLQPRPLPGAGALHFLRTSCQGCLEWYRLDLNSPPAQDKACRGLVGGKLMRRKRLF